MDKFFFRPVYSSLLSSFIIVIFTTVSCSRQPVYPPPNIEGNDVIINVGMLKMETPVFYTHQYRDKHISFFVVKMREGVFSFLDACVSCYTRKLGYAFENGYLRCRACNMEYTVAGIEKGFGSCIPIKLNGRMDKGVYSIPVSQLEGAADKF